MLKRSKLTVFYDGWCPLCQNAKNAIKRRDKWELIQFLSFREEAVWSAYKLAGKQVERRIYSIQEDDGSTFSGIETILEICRRVPYYYVFIAPVRLAIIWGFGHMIYDWVANRRQVIPVGACDHQTCPVHTNKEKGDEES